ncbi:hypothetical protein CQ046_10965 [Chryseobacterium sp. MYb7]|uniref:hypothetical protein n=1 Tax=Chryseobacterium sp. MYb7 TaxID=1827290 RepID=UPI000CFE66BD|nr:hypothetical protein [Chryseobacterium sp. MYb7]PRB03068.1 hypothetical protein CQ046_10965 [Chryseobacterium sp. MYb7]
MKTKENIIQLGSSLPLGSKKLIAESLGMNYRTVDNILKGKEARVTNVMKVLKEAKRILKEYEDITNS